MINTLIVFAVSRGILTAYVARLVRGGSRLTVPQYRSLRRIPGGAHLRSAFINDPSDRHLARSLSTLGLYGTVQPSISLEDVRPAPTLYALLLTSLQCTRTPSFSL